MLSSFEEPCNRSRCSRSAWARPWSRASLQALPHNKTLVGGHVVVQHGDFVPRRAKAPGRAGVLDDLGLTVDEVEDSVGLTTVHALEDSAELVVGARAV